MKNLFVRCFNAVKHYVTKKENMQKIASISSVGSNPHVGENFKLLHGECVTIGSQFYAGPDCRIEAWTKYNDKKYTPKIRIGNNVRINSTCHIGAINEISIGNDCLIGSHVMIIDHAHGKGSMVEKDIAPTSRDLFSKGPISIGDKCWICENVVILPNVHIGNNVTIGANCVVTKDIPANSTAVGNPMRVIPKR